LLSGLLVVVVEGVRDDGRHAFRIQGLFVIHC
jgi:hypothetical protein